MKNVELDRQHLRKELMELKEKQQQLIEENKRLLATIASMATCQCYKEKKETQQTVQKVELSIPEEEDDEYDEEEDSAEKGTIYADGTEISVSGLLSSVNDRSTK